ncbi:MAG: hypothetical protein IJO46_00235, partial [Thermoguttaceae bacterium]|nr:hypothetical protein [Thermoguttaceae bacterium]
QGFEPRLTGSEPAALPLRYTPKTLFAFILPRFKRSSILRPEIFAKKQARSPPKFSPTRRVDATTATIVTLSLKKLKYAR